MFAVDRMSRRRLTGGMLVAVAVTMLNPHAAHAEPSPPIPSSGVQTSTEADLKFELKVRLIGEFPELSDGSLPESEREALLNARLEERWLSLR
ncbi:hypothetical protein [Actinoplanes xinjiangensis]|uniref:hypothetical protein n=1 Tax=Actinoplanes xinjiangensis TaxID=512350 RepID=UPI003427CFAB